MRKRRVYHQVEDGESFWLPRTEWIACCHCGLVHKQRIDLFNVGGRIRMRARVWRDARATAGVRRGRSYRLLKTKKLPR